MLTHQHLLAIGTAADAQALQAALAAAGHELGFGIASGVLMRGRLGSGRALTHSFGNTPEAFLAAFKSADLAVRDPLLAHMLARPGCVTYDQAFYVQAGAADLWDFQAPFGYRHGIAHALHEASHAEVFSFGLDREAPLPSDPERRMRQEVDVQLLAMHAQAAAQRIFFPGLPPSEGDALTPAELAVLQWAADGVTVRRTGERMRIGDAETRRLTTSAARKLGASNRPAAVLRAIDGGLIKR